jgi:hypothetical protein
VAADQTLVEKDGSVTLVVLPVSDHLTPQPDEDQKRAICRWLEPRRLITTELHVIGPRYARVTALEARLTVRQDHDLGAVAGAVLDALVAFLDPITGGRTAPAGPSARTSSTAISTRASSPSKACAAPPASAWRSTACRATPPPTSRRYPKATCRRSAGRDRPGGGLWLAPPPSP